MAALAEVKTVFESLNQAATAIENRYAWSRFLWNTKTRNWVATDAHYLELDDRDKHLALRIFLTENIDHRQEVLPIMPNAGKSLQLINCLFDAPATDASFVLSAIHKNNLQRHKEDGDFISEIFEKFNAQSIFGRKTLADIWREEAFEYFEIQIDFCVRDVIADWAAENE